MYDNTYVISVKEATHRREKIKKHLDSLGIEFEFYITERDSIPTRGCFKSHQKVLEIAKQKGEKVILVFEDDAIPIHNPTIIQNTIKNFFKSPPIGWRFCLLGYLPISTEYVRRGVYGIDCAYDLHAYLVNVDNVDVREWDGKYPDSHLCKNLDPVELLLRPDIVLWGVPNGGVYGVTPMLFKQDTNESYINDISLAQKYFFDFFGGYDNSVFVSSYVNTLYLAISIIVLIIAIALIKLKNLYI